MSDMGLFINPKDGGKYVEITKDRYPLTFLAHIKVWPWKGANKNEWYDHRKYEKVPGMEKYNVVIVPTALTHFWAYGSVQMLKIGRYWIDGDTFRCEYSHYSRDQGYLPGSDGYSHFFLYGTLKDNPPDSYGLFLNAGVSSAIDNFRSITQENEVAYCVYRKKIHIDVSSNRGYWSLPADIPNRSSALVFLRPESTNQVLRYDRPNNRIMTWGAGWVYVVVFSYGLNLQPTDGLTIWNKQGKVVFNSDYIPFFNNGNTISTSNNTAVSSFERPMFSMDMPNTWLENEGATINCYLSGFRVEGNKLIASRMYTSDFYKGYANREYNKIVYSSSYCIDFNDYF
ncbi:MULTISPECIES: DUF6453 family protein [Providencia]|uniref:DUF6453 family protein n=1 Tax=Providencia TaxID=586 RepID=UPI002480A5B4|nr:DUF6453 family protein [Providencia rettgeri]MDU7492132.1 DUF6453 family protein [Providencia rettgeri]HEM8303984.1 hypothetical protein [Providencia rettgeri]